MYVWFFCFIPEATMEVKSVFLVGEEGLPVGIQECLEGFHRGCVEYLTSQFVPKWDSPNFESELATAGTTSLDSMRNSRRLWMALYMDIRSPRIRRCVLVLVLVLASAFTRGGLSRHHQSR